MPLLSPTPKTADLWQSLTPAPRILTLIILAINTLANLPFSILLSVLCYRSYNNVRIYSDGQKAYPESEYAWDPYAPGTTVGLALAPAILILVLGVVDLVLYARLRLHPIYTLVMAILMSVFLVGVVGGDAGNYTDLDGSFDYGSWRFCNAVLGLQALLFVVYLVYMGFAAAAISAQIAQWDHKDAEKARGLLT